jgi:DNA mismatch endonuclease (patch repair protein)
VIGNCSQRNVAPVTSAGLTKSLISRFHIELHAAKIEALSKFTGDSTKVARKPVDKAPAMTDVHTPEQRSRNMSRIRSKDTRPEIAVRRLVHRLGYRFRLHQSDLPGRPDLVLKRHGRVIFVHGCFWHCHNCRYGLVKPSANAEFWEAKRAGNVERDRRNRQQLEQLGWNVLVVWECCTRNPAQLEQQVLAFLEAK